MDYLEEISQNRIRYFKEKTAAYYHECGRKDLTWRQTQDPWKILLAEVLLRKTTAVQVEKVYKKIKDISPEELRDFPFENLESLLKPLGINRERARLLKLIGEKVAESGRERLRDWNFLYSLPGIGRYAANMVLATAFDEPLPGLDRNMIRVLERVFSIESDKARPHTDRMLWEAAGTIVPKEDPKGFNWGILDLASELCRPSSPKCKRCPLKEICDWYHSQGESGKDE